MKPGGRFVVYARLAGERPAGWELRHLLEPICREGRLCRLGTEADYRGLIAASGLDLVEAEDLTRAVRRTWSVCLRRLLVLLLRDAGARRFLLDGRQRNREFALALPRLILAYRTGALRYGLFVAEKPASPTKARA